MEKVLISNVSDFKNLIDSIDPYRMPVSIDTETEGLEWWADDRVIGIPLCVPDLEVAAYVPFRHPDGRLDPAYISYINRITDNPDAMIIGHHFKFDMHMLHKEGVNFQATIIDTMIWSHIANEHERSYALKELGAKYINPNAGDAEDELMLLIRNKSDIKTLTSDKVAPYGIQDAILTYLLFQNVHHRLVNENLLAIADGVSDYIYVTWEMEQNGLRIDRELCAEELAKMAIHKSNLLQQICAEAGVSEYNPNSVPQTQRILGTVKTDAQTLEKMKTPLASKVVEYRHITKLQTSYYEKFLELSSVDGKIHCTLNLHGTGTGRLSCWSPNLQAVPRPSPEEVYVPKKCIIASPGHVLVSIDLNQAELRLLAHYTKERFLMDAYLKGFDIHKLTSEQFGIPRDFAKRINYALSYGVGPKKLAIELDIMLAEAEDILSKYRKQMPGIGRLYRRLEGHAKKDGYIVMWTGRKRRYPETWTAHKALSGLIQGGVGEIMRIALTAMQHSSILRTCGVKKLIQVHDEVLLDVPESEVVTVIPEAIHAMEDFNFRVPIKADCKVGYSWGDMTKWTNE